MNIKTILLPIFNLERCTEFKHDWYKLEIFAAAKRGEISYWSSFFGLSRAHKDTELFINYNQWIPRDKKCNYFS